MLDYIVRRIIGERNPTDLSVRKTCGTIASIVGIAINLLLFAGKFITGTLAGSISITADALNNLSDAASSVISFVSFRISAKPADRDHPFGHERFEYVASLIVSFIILIIGFELFTDSLDKIIHPAETEFSLLAVCVLVVSICFKLILYFFYRSVGRAVDSSVMMASSADSLSDVVSTGAVLIALFVSHLTGINLDGYIGAAVAIFIFISGLKILNEKKAMLVYSPEEGEMRVD